MVSELQQELAKAERNLDEWEKFVFKATCVLAGALLEDAISKEEDKT